MTEGHSALQDAQGFWSRTQTVKVQGSRIEGSSGFMG